MFYVKQPSNKKSPWILSDWSHCKEKSPISIPTNTLKDIKNHQILGIDFLYQAYKKQFKGVILNEEEGMNTQIQVAAFLNAMFNHVDPKFLVLVVAPDHHIVNWHYHLSIHGGLRVEVITPKTCPEDFDQEHGLAILLPFIHIKLLECLVDYDYFAVVIDDFDQVATKLIIRKLHGLYNIGLTVRSFYTHPDQKLQFTMLNWCNPGCVGKLADFYKVDNDNFANFRNNYRHWWFRLTWGFCESFQKPTDKEHQGYTKVLSKWARSNHLKKSSNGNLERAVRKRKQVGIIDDNKPSSSDQITKFEKTIRKSKRVSHNGEGAENEIGNHLLVRENGEIDISDNLTEANHQSSEGTVICAVDLYKAKDPNYVQLPSMDENPILNSIIWNLEKFPRPIATENSTFCSPVKHKVEEANCSKTFEEENPNCSEAFKEENVLMSIIDDNVPVDFALDEETALSYKKEELRSQIFDDKPSSYAFDNQPGSSDFFPVLDRARCSCSFKKTGTCVKYWG
ncbi:hypothetical protein NQ315_001456 [Exocentrus adspersus]|uniref:Uncharacterized protein n=1 Tax=Exocentrus adspersus TaxID=1586481 RepID=A0AAV8W8P8_9CUCU|nr:hypothetical protein NQ315_001456 [Exocentrus adspersus]